MPSREHPLYGPIVDLYERKGYAVEREFRVLLPDAEAGRLVDIMAFRWSGDDVEVTAIEAKPANRRAGVLRGIPQGVEYQVVAPNVLLAAKASSNLLGHAEAALSSLGLGYIECEPGSGAHIAIQPAQAAWFDKSLYEQVLRPGAMLILLAPMLEEATGIPAVIKSAVKRAPKAKGARQKRTPRPTWLCSVYLRSRVQVFMQVRTDGEGPTAGLWVEAKPALRRFWRKVDAEWLAELIEETGVPWSVASRERAVRSLGVPTRTRRISANVAEARRVIRWARREIEKPRVCPVIDARIPLWPLGRRVRRAGAEKAVKAAIARLAPMRDAVEDIIQGG